MPQIAPPRFILLHAGGAASAADLQLIRGFAGITVRDESGRMVLVQSTPSVLEQLIPALSGGWGWTPEQTVPKPDARPKVRKPA